MDKIYVSVDIISFCGANANNLGLRIDKFHANNGQLKIKTEPDGTLSSMSRLKKRQVFVTFFEFLS